MKAVILEGDSVNPGDISWEPVTRLCETKIYGNTSENEKWERINDCEIVLINKTLMTRDVFDRFPKIGYVGVCATGFNVVDIDAAREHEVVVNAKDSKGNLSTRTFTLVVEERKYYAPVYYDVPASAYGGSVVGVAYSLVGYPYIGGANGPYGFDCSGFVQYVYSRVGVNVSRSSSTQMELE